MANVSNLIKVPKPAPGSFNPNRIAGTLLRTQVSHAREALIRQLHAVSELLIVRRQRKWE